MTGQRTEADFLEIIRKQAEQIEHLIAENARLRKRVEELERQQRKYVAPHSRGTRKAAPKSPGRRVGEGLFTYKRPPAPEQEDIVLDVAMPNTCVSCGYVGELIFKRHDRAWVSDLKPQAVQVTAYGSVRLIVLLVDGAQGWPELQATPAPTSRHI